MWFMENQFQPQYITCVVGGAASMITGLGFALQSSVATLICDLHNRLWLMRGVSTEQTTRSTRRPILDYSIIMLHIYKQYNPIRLSIDCFAHETSPTHNSPKCLYRTGHQTWRTTQTLNFNFGGTLSILSLFFGDVHMVMYNIP